MKLRYRFFLLVGTIFLLCLIAIAFLNINITDRFLQNSVKRTRTRLLSMRDMNNFYLQKKLGVVLGTQQAQVNSALLDVAHHPLEANPWTSAVKIFTANRIAADFIQITTDQRSFVLASANAMKHAQEEPIDELLSWVIVEGHPTYLGAILPKANALGKIVLLFSLETLQDMKPSGIPSVDHAIAFAKNQAKPSDKIPGEQGKEQACVFQGVDLEALNERFERTEETNMLAALVQLFPNAAFGDSPLSSTAPIGIASFDKMLNRALFSKEIFYQQSFFSDASYIQQHPPLKGCMAIGNGIAIIDMSKEGKFFIGNTLQLSKGFVTIGSDFERIIKQHLLPGHQVAFAAYEDRSLLGYTSSGKKIGTLELTTSMLRTPSGTISWENQPYYYLHMQPFKEIDLHFYTLDAKTKAFSEINFQEMSAKLAEQKISHNIQIIALGGLVLVLIALHFIAKNLTNPITQLVKATEAISSGKLEGVSVPLTSPKSQDEISKLCRSFSKMIEDLQEKEKIRGVLNKVVSKEIAEEILKGRVHLGGEERRVTVLFADIRHFTEITTQLPPQEVIQLLNICMTKISKVIDDYGGVIDKYVGDEVMALFGIPIDQGDSALRAIKSALKIIEVLTAWNVERAGKNLVQIEMGIGIHSGGMIVGNMGAENRLNYTVIGKMSIWARVFVLMPKECKFSSPKRR